MTVLAGRHASGSTDPSLQRPPIAVVEESVRCLLRGGDATRAARLVEEVVTAHRGDLPPAALLGAVDVLAVCSPLAPAVVDALGRRLASAADRGDVAASATAHARLVARTGRIGTARQVTSTVLASGEPDRATVLPLALHLSLLQGDLATATSLGDQLVGWAPTGARAAAQGSWALAELAAAGGDHELSCERHLRAGKQLARVTTQPAVMPWRLGAAQALTHLGRVREATDLANEDLEGTTALGAAYPHARSLRTMALLRPLDGEELLRQALHLLDGVSADRLLHQLRTDLASHLLLHRGDRAEAVTQLRAVEWYAAGERLLPMLGRARRLLALAGESSRPHPAESRDLLTPAEQAVALLAGRGLSNREVAAELGLTPKSVQWHLSQTYRRLDIHGRKDLPAALGIYD